MHARLFRPALLSTLALALAACGQQSPTRQGSLTPPASNGAVTPPRDDVHPAASGDVERTVHLAALDGGPLELGVDAEGNLYSLSARGFGGEGNTTRYESVVRKYTPDGRVAWQKTLPQVLTYDFAVNARGDVAFVGYRKEATPCENPLPSFYLCDYTGLAQKYDTSGNLVLSLERDTGQPGDYPTFAAVALDEQGALYTFGASEVQKFGDAGNELWGTRLEGNNFNPDLQVDRQNNVYFVRSNIVPTDEDPPYRRQDVFFSKLGADGRLQFERTWRQEQTQAQYSIPRNLALSADGNAYTLWQSLQEGSNYQAFLKKYGQDGTWKFNQALGQTVASGPAPIQGLTTSGNNVYIYGADTDDQGQSQPPHNTPYLSKYDPNGERVWRKDLGPVVGSGVLDDVVTGPDGKLYVAFRENDERNVAIVTP